MTNDITKHSLPARIRLFFRRPTVIYLTLGALSGLICGFLGTGGGIILIFALRAFRKKEAETTGVQGVDTAALCRDAFAETIAVIIPLSIVSAAIYYIRGDFALADTLPYLPAAIIGGFAGAVLTAKLNAKILNMIFAVLVIWAGVCMII
jgi:uncharacterized membrane protein YfcA